MYNYNKYMTNILEAITSYQELNNFYNNTLSKANRAERVQDDNFAAAAPNTAPTDDNAAIASISPEAIALYKSEQQPEQESDAKENSASGNKELTQQEQQEVMELKNTDAKVKAHEHAHKAAAVGLKTTGPNYEYETGPDGKKYAVAGDVNVSYAKSSDPEVNLQNAQKLKAAALAPTDPSSQDRKVAQKADQEIAEAKREIMEEQAETEEEEEASETNSDMTSTQNADSKNTSLQQQ